MIKITRKHPLTGNKNELELNATVDQLERWMNGEHVQNVMPQLSADEREFLISGLLPGEFDKMFDEMKNN